MEVSYADRTSPSAFSLLEYSVNIIYLQFTHQYSTSHVSFAACGPVTYHNLRFTIVYDVTIVIAVLFLVVVVVEVVVFLQYMYDDDGVTCRDRRMLWWTYHALLLR